MIRVIQIGLGPIGLRVSRRLIQSKNLEIVAALDINENIIGRDVGVLAGQTAIGVNVSKASGHLKRSVGDIAVITTSSSLPSVQPQILEAVAGGLQVVSTCEELSYPWATAAEIAESLNNAATKAGVSILGTGINPGFLMDFLPITMTALCRRVRTVRVERIQNAAMRRLPFQKKIGAGLSPSEFSDRVKEGTLRHVGLTESMHMIASRLGWSLERTEDVVEPVLATGPVTTRDLSVQPGYALGVNQTGLGYKGGEPVISLIFRATIGEPQSFDRIQILGEPDIDLRIEGGINGDIGTVAVTVNSIPVVMAADPGLRTMADLPIISCLNE